MEISADDPAVQIVAADTLLYTSAIKTTTCVRHHLSNICNEPNTAAAEVKTLVRPAWLLLILQQLNRQSQAAHRLLGSHHTLHLIRVDETGEVTVGHGCTRQLVPLLLL